MADEETVQAIFYIEPRGLHNRVQHIGCRLILTERLIRAGFRKGGVFNLPDGRVEVILEGAKNDIDAFYADVTANLVKWLEEKTSNKERLRSMIGNPGISFSPIEITHNLRVPFAFWTLDYSAIPLRWDSWRRAWTYITN